MATLRSGVAAGSRAAVARQASAVVVPTPGQVRKAGTNRPFKGLGSHGGCLQVAGRRPGGYVYCRNMNIYRSVYGDWLPLWAWHAHT